MGLGKVRLGMFVLAAGILGSSAHALDETFTQTFPCTSLASTGTSRYFVLQPGWQLVLEGEDDEGEEVELVITVLGQTETVDGVVTRVVEERESVDGELAEVSRNFLAFCNDHGSMLYYGEDVDFYEGGEIVSHEGSWRSGVNGARFGLLMPGLPLLGARYYQEIAPDVALDKGEIRKLGLTKSVPAGTFADCLKVRETNDLEPDASEGKLHAPGVGLIKDGPLRLTSFGFVD